MPTLTNTIQHSLGSSSHNNQRRKINKRNPDQNDMILYKENAKDSVRKLLELISEFSKAVGYKVNTEKSLHFAFLYTNNEKSEREIKESIPFTIVPKINK